MEFSLAVKKYFIVLLAGLLVVSLNLSCDGLWKKIPESEVLARVGEVYLYKEDITSLMAGNMSKDDSISFVTNYINSWAVKQLLYEKAKVNLTEAELAKFDRLVANYQIDLYTGAYKEALVQKLRDSLVTPNELIAFYDREKENFKLKEQIVQLRYIELPPQFLDKEKVRESLQRFNDSDARYLDSIGVQFRKYDLNDSIWVSTSRVIAEIPPLSLENQDRYLKKSQFFELQDSLGVYLGQITDVLKVNDIAPISFIEPTIRQVLTNRKRLDYLQKLETEIIDEAIGKKEFEVY